MKKILSFFIVSMLFYFLFFTQKTYLIKGSTMGTTFSIKLEDTSLFNFYYVRYKSIKELERINLLFSTYISDSEISKFNDQVINTPILVSDEFYKMIVLSKQIYEITKGAWDPTIKPLIDRWGFSEKNRVFLVPTKDELTELHSYIGLENIEILDDHILQKKISLTLDFSSFAKGYAVDVLTNLIKDRGILAGLVEIGGEIRVYGQKSNNRKWTIGINTPTSSSSKSSIAKTIELENEAIATSGDYRNFKEYDGVRYSHIIDPRTGYPVTHNLNSVSVIAPTCIEADVFATAFLVLGKAETNKLLKQLTHLKVVFLD